MPNPHGNIRLGATGSSGLDAPRGDLGMFRALRCLPKLAGTELEFLRRLLARKQTFQVQDELLAEGASASMVYLIEEGWAYRYELLSDGRRQILNLALPGDFIGLRSGLFGIPEHTTVALTAGVATRIPSVEIIDLFRTHPRVAAALAWTTAQEEAMLADRVVSLGRRNAFERVAHFFLELFHRLGSAGLAGENSFPLVLTQELLGDLLGLSVVHINRTLRRLREEKLVSVEQGRVILHNPARLGEISDFQSSYLTFRDADSGRRPGVRAPHRPVPGTSAAFGSAAY